MQMVAKSADGNVMLVQRSTGFAVSRRASRFAKGTGYNLCGVTETPWETVQKGMTESDARRLYNQLAA